MKRLLIACALTALGACSSDSEDSDNNGTSGTTNGSSTAGSSNNGTSGSNNETTFDECDVSVDPTCECSDGTMGARPSCGEPCVCDSTDMGGADEGASDSGGGPATAVAIAGGAFIMGCDDCDPDEAPEHEVILTAFSIDRTEVSQAAYQVCVDAGDCTAPADNFDPVGTPDLPVVSVAWQQAVDYCTWAGGRLPTEAEWERACAGPVGTKYPTGDDEPTCEQAHVDGCTPDGRIAVDSLPNSASAEGAEQMTGNAWEYTADWYAGDAYANHAAMDPTGPTNGERRTVRGGSSGNQLTLGRCSNRSDAYNPEVGGSGVGFRCVY